MKIDYITYWNNKGSYGKERIARMLIRKERRKKSKGSQNVCPICGRDVGYYVDTVINPYHQDISGIEIEEKMCNDCYSGALGDI